MRDESRFVNHGPPRLVPFAILACCLFGLAFAGAAAAKVKSDADGPQGEVDAPDAKHGPVPLPPPPRLQMNLNEGSPDLAWWREAAKTREARIQWWRDAKYGCFIHWNASSLPAGEWQGEVYPGYAEHIQRMAKIPCPVYRREVVGRFNPTAFDADAWVRLIKDSGMRYLVITAKHHDGFAMWDSQVSEYNIVDATPFGRDPIQELKEACERHGIAFGLYYSHAFDWGEPNAPGNDWDYENPGGNRGLFGGLDWFDDHPEIVPRMRSYVDGKSIPQILELLDKYDPDLIWFDTASKLPPEETLRILRKVREAKPDVLVNSRVVFPYDGWPGHYGDYLSTGDRAVEFRSLEGDWETIPTTNESYGYHAHDHSHKTPGYLIQVLAKAVAKGGNILLNVGPRGDGTIDPVDAGILQGIGDWMEVNAASIREAGRTTLPVQPWGQTTRDGNRFYLHVFDWPADGRLRVGALQSPVKGAWMLADTERKPLAHERLDATTVEVRLDGDAPEPARGHAVVVMEVEDAADVGDSRLVSTTQPTLLHGFDGQLAGEGFGFGDGKARRDYIDGWQGGEQKLRWPIYLREPASFEVTLEYQRLGEPGEFTVTSGETVLRGKTQGKEVDNWFSDYIRQDVGTLELPAGEHIIQFAAAGAPEKGLMRLRGIHLKQKSQAGDTGE